MLDLIRRRELVLDSVHTVILDEADRMLDMGFIVDVETILCRNCRAAAPDHAVQRHDAVRHPAHLRPVHEARRRTCVRPDLRTVETVRQLVYFVAEQDKVAALVRR